MATPTAIPQPTRIEVTPSRIFLSPGASQRLTATVLDQFGNEVQDLSLEWGIAEGGGTIRASGLLTSGTKAGNYDVTVTARTAGEEPEVIGMVSMTIEPGVLDRVEIAPRPATVTAGATQQFTATAYDQFDNEISDPTLRWRAREEAGQIDFQGLFSTNTKAAMHADAVVVEALEGPVSKLDGVTVTIEPAPPSRIEVKPSPVVVLASQTQALTATVFDRHYNQIREAQVTWRVVRGGGAIDEKGVFTSGEVLGTYTDTLLVETDDHGAQATARVTVTVAEYLPGKIVFNALIEGNTEIFLVDPHGSNLTRLTFDETPNRHPAWSSDGMKIVFTSWRDGNAEIYSMDADGSNRVRLTDNDVPDDFPSWAPSGDQIAFTSSRGFTGFDIFVMDADGSNQRRLTENEFFDTDTHPYWSPEGDKILYSSDEGDEILYSSDEGEQFEPEVWVMNADGTERRQLTDNQAFDFGVDWFPDGSRILFLSDRDGRDDVDLYIMNPDGSEVTRLNYTPSIREEHASYSPDGTRIVFANAFDRQLWIMTADGRKPKPITEGLILTDYPQWQPNPEASVQPFVIGASTFPEIDEERPGERFPIHPYSVHISEESRYTEYNTVPPTSGPHWEQATPWGIYASSISNERQVANLAQGDVIFQYNTQDLELISRLEEFMRGQDGFPCHLIVAPYLDMPFTIAITAWGVRDTMDYFDETRLQSFIGVYRAEGPEAAPCSP